MELEKELRARGMLDTVRTLCNESGASFYIAFGTDGNGRYRFDRSSSSSRARRQVFAWCRGVLGMSYSEIGKIFGIHHAAVMRLIQRRW